VTTDQILKANPGLNPNSLKVGQKIFIPAPAK
jgi:LysM repeat protein